MTAPLLIIDGDNLAHRAYHSTPKTVVGADGTPINSIVGFLSMLHNIYRNEQPRGVFVAWDTLGVDTYRSKLWPPYQGGRVFEPELVRQLDMLPMVCEAFGFGVGKQAEFEADDLMASAAAAATRLAWSSLILTTDRDSYQLASESVTILAPRRGVRELQRIGPHEVVKELGILPEQVPDFKALSGDASDKIPGIKGIGPKTAATLLLKYGTLEDVLEAIGRPSDTELGLMFREVVRMRDDLTVRLPEANPDWTAGAECLRAIGAANLAVRLASLG